MITANLNAVVLQAFIEHAVQLARAHARLALANRANLFFDTLIKEVQLQGAMHQLMIRLPAALEKGAQARQRIFQTLLFDFEERTLDGGEPKVFFTSI